MKLAPAVLAALAVIVALVVAKECGYREGAKQAEAAQRDRRDDSTVARLVYEAAQREQQFHAERDSTGRVIARLLIRVRAPQTSPDTTVSGGTNSPAVTLAPDVRDTLIASLLSGREQDSLQLLFWKAQVEARDSLIPRITQARDAWRKQAQRPSYAITDIGGGAIAGYGLAERNETAVLVGAGVVLVPRLLGALKRLF